MVEIMDTKFVAILKTNRASGRGTFDPFPPQTLAAEGFCTTKKRHQPLKINDFLLDDRSYIPNRSGLFTF